MAADLPSAVLFACTQNVIRSVMAAAIMQHLYGHKVYVASCGVKPGERDPFVTAVMEEIGMDVSKHRPQGFDDLEDSSFDLVVSLSPEAHHRALEMTRTMAIEAEYWPTLDPSLAAGSREQILDSYRDVRDQLYTRIRKRFGSVAARGV
ncbi:low molecular weight phosphatase family protein [Aestuariivirga sp.]|uniref:arsenate-mycothiol transferase ArsC n=1 Tax=Aestuariivirga sp. TaxID=2650926 RepID=UPI0039E455B6